MRFLSHVKLLSICPVWAPGLIKIGSALLFLKALNPSVTDNVSPHFISGYLNVDNPNGQHVANIAFMKTEISVGSH